jgi:hypothetical protein
MGRRVIVDPAEHVGEPRLRIDVVQLCGFDQCEHCGGALAAAIGASKGPSPVLHHCAITPRQTDR